MRLAYPMRFTPAEEGGYVVQGLPPLDGAITEGETLEEAKSMAKEALTGILAVMLERSTPIPTPCEIGESEDILLVEPEAYVAAPILLKLAREEANVTQGELAARVGIKYQSVQRLERPGANPSLKTLARIARALGKELHIAI